MMNNEPIGILEMDKMNRGRFYAEAGVVTLGALVAAGAIAGFMGPAGKEYAADTQMVAALQQHPQESTAAINRELVAKGQPARSSQELLDTAEQKAHDDAASYDLARTVGIGSCVIGLLAGASLGQNVYRAFEPTRPKPPKPSKYKDPKQPTKRPKGPKRDARYYEISGDMF